jgi:hypothetical protein
MAIHHKEPQIKPDLRRGKANALGRIHGIEHVCAQIGKSLVKNGNGLAYLGKNFFGVFGDLSNGHLYLGITPVRESRRKSRFALKPRSSRPVHSQQTTRSSLVGERNVL